MADDAQIQERVFAFLTEPAAHPGVRRIDTHAASVFLEGNRALKVKRAIRFPFLDYSTLEKRKLACDEELRINRRFAPQIYRRVVAITQGDDGALSVGEAGKPVEYAVEMTRFDERRTLDHLAAAGPLEPALVNATAEAIAASHRAAPHAPGEPWIASIGRIIGDNTTAFRNAGRFAAAEIDELEYASRAAFSGVRAALEQRGRQAHVRQCHGDLHLANIVLLAETPVLFDAIEFDPAMASVDVLYDLAFTLMDLLRYGRQTEANALLNRYLTITTEQHLDALAALPLFLSMRAAIRSLVLLARLARSRTDESATAEAARAYFELARGLIHPSAPTLIAIGGMSGTGKSLLARRLAPQVPPQPGAVVLRSDVLRKQLFGVNETDRLPERAYLPEVSHQIYEILVQRAARALGQGHSVILDAVFAREAERAAAGDAARALGVPFVGLFLVADLATRQSRVNERESDASDATPQVAGLQETYNIGAVDWEVIDASGTPDRTLGECETRIAGARATQVH
jgi:aminoglycoside phosphotransferase family enzyme/predicted kinase